MQEATEDSAHGRAARRAVDIGKAIHEYMRAACHTVRLQHDASLRATDEDIASQEGKTQELHGAVWDLIGDALGKAHVFDICAETQPTTLKGAVASMWAAQTGYEGAIEEARRTLAAWRDADVMGSRVRRGAVVRLMETGLSATAADKAASDDPAYANHKDTVARLLNAKDVAESERDVWFARLLTARETCAVFRQEENAKAFDALDVSVTTRLDEHAVALSVQGSIVASVQGSIAVHGERIAEHSARLVALEDHAATLADAGAPPTAAADILMREPVEDAITNDDGSPIVRKKRAKT